MKKYKFITIEEDVISGEGGYNIRNNRQKDLIGWIDKNPRWNQWVLIPQRGSIWSADCLRDVIDFIEKEILK